jgi:drug/metabolite transporter (DMT)-like permease
MTLEALSGVVLAALLLGETIGVVQLLGGLAILAATILISTGVPAPTVVVEGSEG